MKVSKPLVFNILIFLLILIFTLVLIFILVLVTIFRLISIYNRYNYYYIIIGRNDSYLLHDYDRSPHRKQVCILRLSSSPSYSFCLIDQSISLSNRYVNHYSLSLSFFFSTSICQLSDYIYINIQPS